jgi:hypothetical protein
MKFLGTEAAMLALKLMLIAGQLLQ